MSVLIRKLLLPGCAGCYDCRVLTADGGEFRAHRAFLCTTSPFFRAAFCAEYGSCREVLLTGVSASVLDVLLGYYYTDELHINNGNVTEVLTAADMLLMEEARDLCLDHLLHNMDADNCLGMAALAQWHHWPGFRDIVFCFVREHFGAIWRSSSEYPTVPAALLVELFSSSELNVREEVDLLLAIRRWYTQGRARTKERVTGLTTLLQCARIGLCRESTLNEFRQLNPTLAKSSAFRVAVCEDLQRGPCECSPSPLLLLHYEGVKFEDCKALVPPEPRHDDSGSSGSTVARTPSSSTTTAPPQFPCGRCAGANPERWVPRVPHEMMFMVGGWSSGEERNAIEAYDPRAYRWLMHTIQATSPRAYHGVALVGKLLYVVGGMRGNAYLRSCDCFDTERCVWEPCSGMNMARGYVAVASLDNYVYAVGGRDEFSRTATVERYNPVSNQWTTVSPMSRARSDGSACAFRGKLYASGGFDGRLILSSVEEYTPSSNSWCLVPQMPSPRCSHQMVAMAGRIYIVGGYNGRCRLNTMIASERDATPSSWQTMAPLRVGRSTFAVAQLYGNLYVIGGFNGRTTTSQVECYSPGANAWRAAVALNEPVSAMAACYVRGLALARRLATRGALGLST